MRGYFGIGVEHSKSTHNIGTLWRTAYSFDAALLFTVGRRYERQVSDTLNAVKHVPLQNFADLDALRAALPYGCQLVGVELDDRAVQLRSFHHPERALYLLGAEDHGLTTAARAVCHQLVMLPGRSCLNVASAGSIVLAHRVMQHEREAELLREATIKMRKQIPQTVIAADGPITVEAK